VSSNALDAMLYSALTGDSALTDMLATATSVWKDGQVDEEAPFPYVVFSSPALTDTYVLGNGYGYADHMYTIKGVAQGYDSASKAQDIGERIFALINLQTFTLSEGTMLLLRRETGVDFPMTEDNEVYHHNGGVYRIEVQ